MKRLMTLMLGMSLALGCVTVSFAQGTTNAQKSKKKGKKKGSKAPKKGAGA
jgi:hypothetical protein